MGNVKPEVSDKNLRNRWSQDTLVNNDKENTSNRAVVFALLSRGHHNLRRFLVTPSSIHTCTTSTPTEEKLSHVSEHITCGFAITMVSAFYFQAEFDLKSCRPRPALEEMDHHGISPGFLVYPSLMYGQYITNSYLGPNTNT